MGGITDTEKFERFQIKDVGKQIKNNKTNSLLQFLFGGATPLGAALWSKIFGRELTPFVNQLGGPTKKRFKDARQSGIDTGLSEKSHTVAGIIAAYNGAQGLEGLLPQAGGAVAGSEGLGAAASGQALGSTAGVGTGAQLGNTAGLLQGGGGTAIANTGVNAIGNTLAGAAGATGPLAAFGGGTGAAATGQAAGSTVGGGPEGFKIDGSSGNSFTDQLKDQRPNMNQQQQQGGGGAMDKIQLIQLMMEIRRLQEEKEEEARRRRFSGQGF